MFCQGYKYIKKKILFLLFSKKGKKNKQFCFHIKYNKLFKINLNCFPLFPHFIIIISILKRIGGIVCLTCYK